MTEQKEGEGDREETRTCRKCGRVGLLGTDFYRHGFQGGRPKYSYRCRTCETERVKEYKRQKLAEDPEGYREHLRLAQRKSRKTRGPDYDNRQGRAYRKATSEVVERHRDEFEEIYQRCRREEGL